MPAFGLAMQLVNHVILNHLRCRTSLKSGAKLAMMGGGDEDNNNTQPLAHVLFAPLS